MKKILRYFCLSVIALGFMLCTTVSEAAYVALVPLINKTENNPELGQVYYMSALDAVKSQSTYDILDGDTFELAVEKYLPEGQLPTKEQLEQVAKASGADVILAMELDGLDYRDVNSKEGFLELNIDGYCVSYDKRTGIFKKHDFSTILRDESTSNARGSWVEQQFSRAVKREVNKALGKKKISLDHPRMKSLK